jgi:hypothetical protein
MSIIEQPVVNRVEHDDEIQQITDDTKKIAGELALKDSSQFSAYMDSGKFAQLWRVGVAFSKSLMVPDHFKNKPADCFIVCQMAMRLGLDPFMLLQKTYVIGGKPAFESQIAIALVNTSGLFKTNIRYEITGTGDDLGCVAWVIDRDGKRLEGPRVSIATAKAEGWMGRNGSKWRTIPTLMMQYRAAAWFARLYCPERLMGMLTEDEARDIVEATPPAPSPLQERMDAAKKAKDVTLPNDGTKYVDSGEQRTAIANAEQERQRQIDELKEVERRSASATAPGAAADHAGQGMTTAGASNTDAPAAPPAEAAEENQAVNSDMENAITLQWADFCVECCKAAAKAPGNPLPDGGAVHSAIAAHVLKLGRKGKESNITADGRRRIYSAIADGLMTSDGKIQSKGA